MVCICIFSPFEYTDTELTDLAERKGVLRRFGDGERERIDKISNSIGRALSLGGLCALGRALDASGFPKADMRILRDKFGKPRFAGGAPHFSIAHAGGLSVAAVSCSDELGVDIERIDRARDTDRIASKFFSASERETLRKAEDRVAEFYRIWTAKEAMMKQGGEGMISVMRSDSARAEESGERGFVRYTISFNEEEYVLTLCTADDEKPEILTCDGVLIMPL